MQIHPLFRKKWFWFSFITFMLFAFVFDIIVAFRIGMHSVMSGRWNMWLLVTGMLYAGLIAYRPFVHSHRKPDMGKLTRVIWFVLLIWSIHLYGFWLGLYFIATVTILSRFIRWGIWVLRRFSSGKQKLRQTVYS